MSNRPRPDLKHIRVEEGQARNEAWAKLSTDAKIKSLKARRGESKRQMAKLNGPTTPQTS